MDPLAKGKSPFYPGQPVPVELFAGRQAQIDRILERGARQVALGKPTAFFIQGEYGIGKSSIANYVQARAEIEHALLPIYATLGGAQGLDDVGAAVLQAALRSGAMNPSRAGKFKDWLARYVGQQSLFGLAVHLDQLRRDAPTVGQGLLAFLTDVFDRVKDTGIKGIFLILDEINGITAEPAFSRTIKGLIETNATGKPPLPVLLMMCGVEERRRDMARGHPEIDRLFDIIEIEAMTEAEMGSFFTHAFQTVNMTVHTKALPLLTWASAGFPKIMHLVGDAAFWTDRDGIIDEADARAAVLDAADEVGKKYVDRQVLQALRSQDYRSILDKIMTKGLHASFLRRDVSQDLSDVERGKLDNFLQRMKRLNVLRRGEANGEYVFTSRMTALYLWLEHTRKRE